MKPSKTVKRLGPKIWTKVDGQLRCEVWVPCRVFAVIIKRPYATVLDWMRAGWIPALEFGTPGYWTCITPLVRAKLAYKALQKSGKLRRPRR